MLSGMQQVFQLGDVLSVDTLVDFEQVLQLSDVLPIDTVVDSGQQSAAGTAADGFLDLVRSELDVVDDAEVGREGTQNTIVSEVHDAVFVMPFQGVDEISKMRLGGLEDVGFILGKRNG